MLKELIIAIEREPVIAGERHTAEPIISFIVKNEAHYIDLFYLAITIHPNIRADLFKLLCRLESKYLDNLTFYKICRRFLNDENIEVVDASISMFESFSDKSILKEWLNSSPNKPQWVLDYANQVINQDSSL